MKLKSAWPQIGIVYTKKNLITDALKVNHIEFKNLLQTKNYHRWKREEHWKAIHY